MKNKMFLLLLLGCAFTGNETSAATIIIQSDWSYREFFSAGAPRLDFRTGPTYSLPAFNNSLGKLTGSRIKLDGSWNVSGGTSRSVSDNQGIGAGWQIAVNEGTLGTFPGNGLLFVEGVGAGGGRGSSSFSGGGTFESVGRNGVFRGPNDQPQLTFASRVSVGSTQNFTFRPTVNAEFSAAGKFTTSYDFQLADGVEIAAAVKPVLVSTTVENGQPVFVEANPENGAVGQVQDLVGTAEIIRVDGTREFAANGTRVNLGDQVETMKGASLTIDLVDGSNSIVTGNSRIDIDEYIYDPLAASRPDFSPLKGIFKYTSDLLGVDDNSNAEVQLFSVGGIRGDASEIIRKDLLNNPTPNLGSDVGIALETASPVGVNTYVESTSSDFNIEWSMAFLDPAGTFSLSYGGVELFSVEGSSETVGVSQTFSIAGDFATPGVLSELLFNYDGEAGKTLLLWDILFNGTKLDNLNFFGRTGKGPVSHFLLANDEQLKNLRDANLLIGSITPVPIPTALPLLAGGLGLLAFSGWRRQKRASKFVL